MSRGGFWHFSGTVTAVTAAQCTLASGSRGYDGGGAPLLISGTPPLLSCRGVPVSGKVSPVSGQQPVQPRRRLGEDLRGFASQLLVPGAG
jgi:hypothetical protein